MEAGEAPPSLFSLCIKATASTIAYGCDYMQDLLEHELPVHFLENLVMDLTPLALHTLHETLKGNYAEEPVARDNSNTSKQGRYKILDQAWEKLYKKRWTEQWYSRTPGWHQMYCERHLNECFEEAIETALLPTFSGSICELTVSDKIMDAIGHEQRFSDDWKKLSYHCSRFGLHSRYSSVTENQKLHKSKKMTRSKIWLVLTIPYLSVRATSITPVKDLIQLDGAQELLVSYLRSRYLRLPNVLCVQEMAELLIGCKLERLTFIRIKAQNQMDGACMLINQNRQTLHCLQFIHCQLPPGSMNQVYDSICAEESAHSLRTLAFISSRFYETKFPGLLFLLSSGRNLKIVYFWDIKLQQASVEAIFQPLLQSSCKLHSLEMPDNYVSLSVYFMLRAVVVTYGPLRSNCLEQTGAEELCFLLQRMPILTSLDLSDNTLTDEGIRYLIPFFVWAFGKEKPLSDLSLENCNITEKGFHELIRHCLPVCKEPLNKLSLSNNRLGSAVAENLAKLMGESHVKELKIEDISLGESGFRNLILHMPREVSLSHINVSKNQGRVAAANFISEIIRRAPHLVSINAAFNIMPPQSVPMIFNALDVHFKERGKLELLDLTNNAKLFSSAMASEITKFQRRGNPVVILFPKPRPGLL